MNWMTTYELNDYLWITTHPFWGGARVTRRKMVQKFIRSAERGNITIKDEIYTLKNNNLKRELIYDKDNKFVDTKPLILIKGKLE